MKGSESEGRKEDLCFGFTKCREEVESGKNNYAEAFLFFSSLILIAPI